MSKEAISVTLDAANITWLKGRAGAARLRSVSALLNQIVTHARQSSGPHAKSVFGTVTIDAADPDLQKADAAVRAMFDASLDGSSMIRERAPGYGRRTPRAAGKRRG